MLGLGNRPTLWKGIGRYTHVIGIDTAELMNRLVCQCALSISNIYDADTLFIPAVKRHPDFFDIPCDWDKETVQEILNPYLEAFHGYLGG